MSETMKKVIGGIRAVICRVLFLGGSAQIVLGIFWLCRNFGTIPDFWESKLCREAGKTLICDEYMGIAYPLLIRTAEGIAGIFPLPFFVYLYLIQILLAFGAAHYFLKSFWPGAGRWFTVWGALVMLTVPFAMQCQLAVLPHSVTGSLFLMELGCFRRAREEKNRPVLRIVKMGLLWLMQALLMPEFLLFGGLPIVAFAVICLLQKYGMQGAKNLLEDEKASENGEQLRRMLGILLVTAVFLMLVPKIREMTIQRGAYGRMGNSPEASAMRRFAWDNFGELYEFWPDELIQALPQSDITTCNRYPDRKIWILGEKVDAVYGEAHAREIYGQVAKAGMRERFSRNMKEILQDLAGYALPTASQLWFLSGKSYDSFSGYNYDIMRSRAPYLTAVYLRYCALWMPAGILAAVFLMLAGRKRMILLPVLSAGLMVLWYTFQGGGMLDPKNGIVISLLWGAFICGRMLQGYSDDREAENGQI